MALYMLSAWMLAWCFIWLVGSWHAGQGFALAALAVFAVTTPLLFLRRRRPATAVADAPPCPAPDAVCAVRTEAALPGVLDQLHLVLFRAEADGRLAYVNRAWEAMSGRAVADTLGRSLAAFVHPSEAASIERGLLAVARGEQDALGCELRLVDAGGKPLRALLRAQPCLAPGGAITGLVGTLEEVSRRRGADNRNGNARHQVNTLLANVPGMVYRCRNDPSWTMEFVSDGCLELTGYEPWELLESRRISYGDLIHPEDREFVWTQVQAHVARREAYQIAYRIEDAAGRERWVWEQGRGVFSAHGELLAIEGFVTDVSERRGAEERARRRIWFEARTGMTGRPIFEALLPWTLQFAQLSGHPCALLCVHLLGVEALTERHGHERAEQVLTAVARRFTPATGAGAVSCYLGNHQFAVLVADFRSVGIARAAGGEARELIPAVSRYAARLAEALAAPVRVDGARHAVEIAVGIAMSDARYAGADAMLAAAEQAALQARAIGPGTCEFADE